MRVAILDDSALFRDGLTALLRSAGVEAVSRFADADALVSTMAEGGFDVAILDIRMPPDFTDEGLQAAARVRHDHPGTGILLLSTYAFPEYAARLLRIGTRSVGYLLKDRVSDTATLFDALGRIAAGESVIEPELIDGLLRRERTSDVLDRLSPRESDVLRLLAQGRSNAGIARELFLHVKTVEHHIRSVFEQLDLPDTSDDNRRVLATLEWLRRES